MSRGLDQSPLGLALALADPHRMRVALDDVADGVRVVALQRRDCLGEKGPLLERKGVPHAEIGQVRAECAQVELPLDAFRPVDVGHAGALVIAQPLAQIDHQRSGRVRGTRYIREGLGQPRGQIEHELAEQQEAPQLVRDGRPRLAPGLELEPEGGLEQVPCLADPGVLCPQCLGLPVAWGEQRKQDVARRFRNQQGAQARPAEPAAHGIDHRETGG